MTFALVIVIQLENSRVILDLNPKSILIVVAWNLFRMRYLNFYSDENFSVESYDVWHNICNRDTTEKFSSNLEFGSKYFSLAMSFG